MGDMKRFKLKGVFKNGSHSGVEGKLRGEKGVAGGPVWCTSAARPPKIIMDTQEQGQYGEQKGLERYEEAEVPTSGCRLHPGTPGGRKR